MSSLYPHIIFLSQSAGDSSRDADGNWMPQAPLSSLLSVCRESKNGKGSEIWGADGKMHIYASVISVPLSCPDIQYGTIVFVKESETATTERIRGSVKLFDRGQFNCRIYL